MRGAASHASASLSCFTQALATSVLGLKLLVDEALRLVYEALRASSHASTSQSSSTLHMRGKSLCMGILPEEIIKRNIPKQIH
jgi:hypothetical protein